MAKNVPLVVKFLWESVLDDFDRTILPVSVLLEVLDSCEGCTLLECVLGPPSLVKLTILFRLGVSEAGVFVDNRVFVVHRVFSEI